MPLALVQGDRMRPPFGFLPIRRLWLRTLSAPLKPCPTLALARVARRRTARLLG